jgi:hypothetical protein
MEKEKESGVKDKKVSGKESDSAISDSSDTDDLRDEEDEEDIKMDRYRASDEFEDEEIILEEMEEELDNQDED